MPGGVLDNHGGNDSLPRWQFHFHGGNNPNHPTPGREGGPGVGGWGRVFFLMILKTYPLFPNIRKSAVASFSKSAVASFFLQPTFIRGRKVPGTIRYLAHLVPGTTWYLARSGTWHDLADLVPGTISPSIWSPGTRSALDNYLID